MKLKLILQNGTQTMAHAIEMEPGQMVHDLKEKLYLENQDNETLKSWFDDHNSPYSSEIKIIHKSIILMSMNILTYAGVKDGDELTVVFSSSAEGLDGKAPESEPEGHSSGKMENKKSLKCNSCGKEVEKESQLRYHSGFMSRQEWVNGVTIAWTWSCCQIIVNHPNECHHPKGCQYGLCVDCRTDCACNRAREIRQKENEERF